MNAISTIEPRDDLAILMPECKGEERALREKLRAYRNAASALVASTQSANARCLAWMIVETVTIWLYAPADEYELSELNRFTNRLLITATQAEALHDEGIAA
jgi:hypothetical protein